MKRMTARICRILDAILNTVVLIVCILLVLISGYSLWDNLRIYRNADDPSLLTYKPAPEVRSGQQEEDWVALNGQSAWLCIDNSYIDYPVMQGTDNYEYLNKDPHGDFRISGSIFLDYRNSPDLLDDYSMIYGHHMEHYAMFGSLDLFTSEAYFNGHRTGWIATRNGTYGISLFAVAWGNALDQTVFNPANRTIEEILAYIDENAVINAGYEPGRKIVALSTCTGETELSRLIVFGMITPGENEQ